MLAKIGKFVAKNALYTAMNVVIPGSGSLLKRANQAMNVATFLGPRATLENVETVMGLMDSAGEFAKDTAESILDSLF